MNKEEEKFFNSNFNKKGLSSIVISLILIVLALIAIGIIWAVISTILSESSSGVGLSQFTISLDITNAYENEGTIITFVTRKVGKGNLIKLRFIISNGEESEIYNVETNIKELESRKYIVPVFQLESSQIKTISIAPIFEYIQGKEIIGDVLDVYTLNKDNQQEGSCSPNCEGKECGSDGCDGLCGECNPLTQSCNSGICILNTCEDNRLDQEVCEDKFAECGMVSNKCGTQIFCGDCNSEESCINNICVAPNCLSDPPEETCGESKCGTKINNCGEIVNCGDCEIGETCIEGTCTEILPINTGIVEDVWPGTSNMYFGSSNLSTTANYLGYFAKFPESKQQGCLIITLSKLPMTGYDKSHIGFGVETLIEVGDNYQIYDTKEVC
jgi:hypothetical protein